MATRPRRSQNGERGQDRVESVPSHPYRRTTLDFAPFNLRMREFQAKGHLCPGMTRAAEAAAHGAAATIRDPGGRDQRDRAVHKVRLQILKTSSVAARTGCGAYCRAAAAPARPCLG